MGDSNAVRPSIVAVPGSFGHSLYIPENSTAVTNPFIHLCWSRMTKHSAYNLTVFLSIIRLCYAG